MCSNTTGPLDVGGNNIRTPAVQQAGLHAPVQDCGWVAWSLLLVLCICHGGYPAQPCFRSVGWFVCLFNVVPVLGQHCCGTGMQATLRHSVVPGILRNPYPTLPISCVFCSLSSSGISSGTYSGVVCVNRYSSFVGRT